MTGFARADGAHGSYRWAWELKSVNAKGLEIRLRLPPGWDSVEVAVRARAAEALTRGTVYATLTANREGVAPVVRVNEPVLAAILGAMRDVAGRIEAAPASLDGVLGLKGVIEGIDQVGSEDDHRAAEAAFVAGFGKALGGLAEMRRHEGAALAAVLIQRLGEIAALTERAEAVPGRKPDAIRERLKEQLAQLLESSDRFDADRLHQEAILIAAQVDGPEELDPLVAHVAQGRRLLEQGGAVGRRLDFLAQELNREANTLCSKSN